jgi:AcrR family transcriptional regulator
MPRADEIATVARELVEEEGWETLTMRRLAERVGVQAPSLYKHFRDKRELQGALSDTAVAELAAAVAGATALRGLASAYRAWAHAHPSLYRLATAEADRLPPLLHAFGSVPPLTDADDEVVRAALAFVHGMVELELSGWSDEARSVSASWDAGIAAFASAPERAERPPASLRFASFRVD